MRPHTTPAFARPRRAIQRFALALLALLVAATGLLGQALPAAAALPTPVPVAPPPGEVLDTNAKAVLTWSVPPRYPSGWVAYQSSKGAYADHHLVGHPQRLLLYPRFRDQGLYVHGHPGGDVLAEDGDAGRL